MEFINKKSYNTIGRCRSTNMNRVGLIHYNYFKDKKFKDFIEKVDRFVTNKKSTNS